MIKLTLIAASAAAVLAAGATQAQAHEDDYLPAPAYAYAGQESGYADETGNCDAFTIVGAHAGATVLGFNAGVGGHFGVGDKCERRHHHFHPAYAPQPPQADPYPAAYPQAPWGAPYAYRTYGQPAYAPPPPPPMYEQPQYGQPQYGPMYGEPCGCMRPQGW